MPNKYIRKQGVSRGQWTQESLSAIAAVHNGSSVKNASETYNIPRKTLERRIRKNKCTKGSLGPPSQLGQENERRLVRHIKDMQNMGFPLTRDDVRSIAYHFANGIGVHHTFNKNHEKAGYDWLKLFLDRNRDLSLRKSEGVSIHRAQAMNREEIKNYFDTLEKCLQENNLLAKPSHVFNMDESGLQLNQRPGEVLAQRGARNVSSIVSAERGETITVVACCNAEGVFMPPACIMKGKIKKMEYMDNMPPGSLLYMSEKSAYINTIIFIQWLKEHFIPRKPEGKVILILDGHASHSSSVEMIEVARENDIILFVLPSHTTHYLQPLDRSVFKSLMNYYYAECNLWCKNHPGRKLTRYQFGELLQKAWGKAATSENAIAGFKATGIFPFNPSAIPQYAFSITDQGKQLQADNDKVIEPRKQVTGSPQPSTSKANQQIDIPNQVIRSEKSSNWTLQIKFPQLRDSGIYECQVNTEPKMSLPFRLNVIEAKAMIIGSSDLHVREGSSVTLTCTMSQGPHDLSSVFWYKEDKIVQPTESNEMQRITIKNSWTDVLSSQLHITSVNSSDSGKYACDPTSGSPAYANLYVITGEHPAAMHHGNRNCSPTPFVEMNIATTLAIFIFSRLGR